MAKNKLEGLTKEQLQSRAEQLEHEIETLKNVIEASNTTVFDLLIGEVKKEMQDNIAEEEWKKLKENQKKIESYRSIEKTLQNQEDLLERKIEELEDVQSAIDCYQPTIFEAIEENESGTAEKTGFETDEGEAIQTGDIYHVIDDPEEPERYVLIKKSNEIENSFAMISNFFEGERCLQYPSNRKILDQSIYVGNIYNAKEDSDTLAFAELIADYQQLEPETSDEENSDS